MQREGSPETRSGDGHKMFGGCLQIHSLRMDLLQSPEAPALDCRAEVRHGRALQAVY